MSNYLKSAGNIYPSVKPDYINSIPVGTYTVGYDDRAGWYLSPISDFEIKHKIYGKTHQWADRIINTYKSRPNTTGVLLDGEKGSGKTLLSKLVSINAAQLGMPTLIINSPYQGDSFNSFIQSIDQECVIIFDEFEKVFNSQELQNGALTLLDGVYPSKKLFILTSNDRYRINTHMINRPGRIFYFIEYSGIDSEFVREYCQDNLNNKDNISQVENVASLFKVFNFDLLAAIVEEMNRYDESAIDAMTILNAKPFSDGYGERYDVDMAVNGIKIDHNFRLDQNPLSTASNTFEIYFNTDEDEREPSEVIKMNTLGIENCKTDSNGYTEFKIQFHHTDLKASDMRNGIFVFEKTINDRVYRITATKRAHEKYDWKKAMAF